MECEEFSEEAFLAESIKDLNLRLDLYFESPNIYLRLEIQSKLQL